MDDLACRDIALDLVQEADELLMPMALHVLAHDLTGEHVQRSE